MVQVTHPGVYIEEVPSGVRTVTGVSTSITAFVGRTLKGSSTRATRVSSFGAFEKEHGGLWRSSTLSYAVRQFFQNGGTDAVIVRIINGAGEPASITLDDGGDGFVLNEAHPGTGGHTLRVQVTDDGARHLIVTEIARSLSGAEVVVRRADYGAADAAALAAALEADPSLVEPAEPPDVLPEVADAVDLPAGTHAARAATAPLALAGEALVLTAVQQGEDGDDIAITVLPSASNLTSYAIVVERRGVDGTYAALGLVEAVTNAGVAEAIGDVADIGVVVTGDPSALARPLEARRVHLSGGAEAAAATLALPTVGLSIAAANEGAWGNRIRVRVDHQTADPDDDALFNLTVELLDDNDRPATNETLRNLSVDPDSPRFVTTVLDQSSRLVRVFGVLPETAPAPTTGLGVLLANGEDGGDVESEHFTGPGMQGAKLGLYQLEDVELFNLLVIPPLTPEIDVPAALWTDALAYVIPRRAMLLVDSPSAWNTPDQAIDGIDDLADLREPNAVIYFPRVRMPDPLRDNALETYAPSGLMAGLMARTDSQRGVWKAPAGLEATLRGVRALSYPLIDAEVGRLNPLGINCLQVRPAAGPVAWGARTLRGDDRLASEWKYIPVRRLALMIEESLYRGTQFAVFEPNDRPLWQQLRLAVGTFMNQLFRRGAFQGATPNEAYFVKCDDETTQQADIDSGIVNVEVGFAPLKPAEFVIIRIRQMTGQTET